LLTKGGIVKLCDLGVSKYTEEGIVETKVGDLEGTPEYMPPEMTERLIPVIDVSELCPCFVQQFNISNGKAWDIYSCGVLFWWMWHGGKEEPYSHLGKNLVVIIRAVRSGERPIWAQTPKAPVTWVELVEILWSQEHLHRPSAAEALKILSGDAAQSIECLTRAELHGGGGACIAAPSPSADFGSELWELA
jgi:serine/threonine protein kinase